MSKRLHHIVFLATFLLLAKFCFSQKDTTRSIPADSLVKKSAPIADKAKADSIRRAFVPKKATIRSALIPGWGQIYNKKYWKVPIVYGALGTAAGIFLYNVKNYKDLRFAYAAKFKAQSGKPADSVDYYNIKDYLKPYSANDLRTFRDEFRSNVDYSVLAFILLWGLQVADATVDAHLKLFDVSPNLSLRFKFGPSQMAGTTGFNLVLDIKSKKSYSHIYQFQQ